jgi:eukaryotic-like serine/threonine-protein kinase
LLIKLKPEQTASRKRCDPVPTAALMVASRMRRSLGESLGSIRKYDALLERTTPSLEALQALSLGAQERRRGRTAQAMAFYRRALELDPNFAFAYSRLAVEYRNDRQPAMAEQYAAKAYALRDRLSERERLEITSLYHELVTGDIGKNIEALQIFQRIYPKEAMPPNNLAVAYVTLGQFDQGVEEGRIAMRLDPTVSIRYAVLGNSLIRLNRFAEASDVYRRALERNLENFSIHRGLFRIAFVNQDTAAMKLELSWASRNSHEDAALEWQAKAAAFGGKWQRSEAYAARAIEAANRMQEPEVAAVYAAESALWGAAMGQCSAVQSESSETPSAAAGASEEDQVSLTRMGLALALCGETDPAQSKVAEMKRRYPQNTLMNWIWLPAIESALEMKSENAAKAVDLLEPARRYEAGAEFWPQYLRAQAYLRLGKGDEAAAEFSKILDHSGQDVASPLYPVANLGLAQSMHLQHEIAKARKSAEAFLLEWKEADSDLLFLKEAREQFGHAQ